MAGAGDDQELLGPRGGAEEVEALDGRDAILVERLARRVDGVVGVRSLLTYRQDDGDLALLEYVVAGPPERGLVTLERRFEGAYPYLAAAAVALVRRGPRRRGR